MKLIARLVAATVATAALIGTAPAFAADAEPLDAWTSALENADTSQANVVWLGSSTTVGGNSTTTERRYVNLVTDRLGGVEPVSRVGATFPDRNTAPGVRGYLSAMGGTTSENYVNNTTRAFILWEKPSLIVHMIGSNDSINSEPSAVTPEEYEANVAAEVDKINAGSTQPISQVLVHTYRRAGTSAEKWALYRDALERIASTRDNVLVLDISGEYEAADHLGADPRNLIDTDNTHQTDAGHAFMADLLAPMLGAAVPVPVPVEPDPEPAPLEATPGPTGATQATPVEPEQTPAPITAPTATTAPAPVEADAPDAPRRVRAMRDGRRTTVAWRKVAAADAYEVRCGQRIKRAVSSRAVVRATANRCSVRSLSESGVSPWVRATVKRLR